MRYTVILKPSAVKQLDKLPGTLRERILDTLANLEANPRPRGCKKLKGAEDLYRVRVGSYRIVYGIADRELQVLIVAISHRKDAY